MTTSPCNPDYNLGSAAAAAAFAASDQPVPRHLAEPQYSDPEYWHKLRSVQIIEMVNQHNFTGSSVTQAEKVHIVAILTHLINDEQHWINGRALRLAEKGSPAQEVLSKFQCNPGWSHYCSEFLDMIRSAPAAFKTGNGLALYVEKLIDDLSQEGGDWSKDITCKLLNAVMVTIVGYKRNVLIKTIKKLFCDFVLLKNKEEKERPRCELLLAGRELSDHQRLDDWLINLNIDFEYNAFHVTEGIRGEGSRMRQKSGRKDIEEEFLKHLDESVFSQEFHQAAAKFKQALSISRVPSSELTFKKDRVKSTLHKKQKNVKKSSIELEYSDLERTTIPLENTKLDCDLIIKIRSGGLSPQFARIKRLTGQEVADKDQVAANRKANKYSVAILTLIITIAAIGILLYRCPSNTGNK